MQRTAIILFLSVLCVQTVFSSHNRAGEITFIQKTSTKFEIILTTYADTDGIDRCLQTLKIKPAGSSAISDSLRVYRINGPVSQQCGTAPNGKAINAGEIFPGTKVRKNIYAGEYSFSTNNGKFVVYLLDPKRNADIVNIPNSQAEDFYIESVITLLPDAFGTNGFPVFSNPSVVYACAGTIFFHDPGVFDPDNDSLSFHIDSCRTKGGQVIKGYTHPKSINNPITVNPITGLLEWDAPPPLINTQFDEYNLPILVREFRKVQGKYIVISETLSDMQFIVMNCSNNPPVIDNIAGICVEAGQVVSFPVKASDPDNDSIFVTASGQPFHFAGSSAVFPDPAQGKGSIAAVFSWQTSCEHVRKLPYAVKFRVRDNGKPNLYNYRTVYITVVAPSPKNPISAPSGKSLHLSWDQSVCSNAIGYNIFRRTGSYGFTPGICETGVPAYTGYSLIGTNTGVSVATFVDDDQGSGLSHGIEYCYMVTAFFKDEAKSYASIEFCDQLKLDVPIMTNVTVAKTDPSAGEIKIAWISPPEIDTIQHSGPYSYKLFKNEGFSGPGTFLANTINHDYLDAGINTKNEAFTYTIEMYDGNNTIIGSSDQASSVYLSITPGDNTLTLEWKEKVSWTNASYEIFKWDGFTYVPVGITSQNLYEDKTLVNGREYCYYVQSRGSYSASGLPAPLLNSSQEVCGTPVDTIPPCAPDLTVVRDCELVDNSLEWNNPNLTCADDVVKYKIYFSPGENGIYTLIMEIDGADNTSYLHNLISSLAGCYYITAVDSFANESSHSHIVCVDNCPLYSLPNVFTPDGDASNELLIPFPYKFVDDIHIEIFNRWGQLVYKTSDPDIRWSGGNLHTNQDCPEGTYYYVCTVNEIRLNGIVPRKLTGFVHLLRGSKNTVP